MKKGFDNDKYLQMQSEHIRERIAQFDNKLYLEFGGKLFDDYHASRVLPGFQPDSKIRPRSLSSSTLRTSSAARCAVTMASLMIWTFCVSSMHSRSAACLWVAYA